MKTAELTGALLDYWVARAEGHADVTMGIHSCFARIKHGGASTIKVFAPSSTWDQGGPIIEREMIALDPHSKGWDAKLFREPWMPHQPTPLIAAMRAYVASKFGAEFPDESGPPA